MNIESDSTMPFLFLDNASPLSQETYRLALIPCNVPDRNTLLDVYQQVLSFPDYFGRNWDAFDECMRDLSWIKDKRIAVVHGDLPLSLGEGKIYLEILRDAVVFWASEPDHVLEVTFPMQVKVDVLRRLG